jgi:hypothetical protein
MLNHSKTIMAKLLANENIYVKHTNQSTAFFDVEARVLALPLWNNEKIYDLLVGHEVGHALFTPTRGWMSISHMYPYIPQAVFNIVEDVRIERLMLKKYPGLLSAFKRGYKDMFDSDKMAINKAKHISLQDFSFLDRFNIKAKLRDLVTVEFTKDEQVLFDKAHKTETWQDVVNLVLEIQEHTRKVLELAKITVIIDENAEGHVVMTDPQEQSDNAEQSNDDRPSEEGSEGSDTGENTGVDTTAGSGVSVTDQEVEDAMHSQTDEALEEIKHGSIEKDRYGNNLEVMDGIHPAHKKQMMVTFDQLQGQRIKDMVKAEDTKNFILEIKDTVSVMIKDFELRKSAFQFKKATISKTGTLDLKQLHNYKFSDDIFVRSTKLGEYKNHGIVMLVDYSGSMSGIMPDVLRQLLILVSFCKRANIPFDVWGFTENGAYLDVRGGYVPVKNAKIFNLISSFMDKETYNLAFSELVARTDRKKFFYTAKGYESMNGTPLTEALLAMEDVIKTFRQRTNVQKLSMINLTDGEGGPLGRYGFIKVNGKFVKYESGMSIDEAILNTYKSTGLLDNTLNYFLCNYVPYRFQSNNKRFDKTGQIIIDNVCGYDRVILLNTNKINKADEELEITSLKKSDISRSFKKFNSNKKLNRVVATKFSEIIA